MSHALAATAVQMFLPQLRTRRATGVRPSAHEVTALARHQVVERSRPIGVMVHCISGCLWLTHDGDCRDIVLHAGESHKCDRRERLLVQGLEDSRLLFA